MTVRIAAIRIFRNDKYVVTVVLFHSNFQTDICCDWFQPGIFIYRIAEISIQDNATRNSQNVKG